MLLRSFLPMAVLALQPITSLPTLAGPEHPYDPTPDQNAFLSSPFPHSHLISGYGGGKSQTLCVRILLDALECPGTYGLGAPTHGMLKRSTWKTMKATVPGRLLKGRPTEPPDARIELVNGATIEGYHLSDPDALDGPNLSGFGIDEVNGRRIKEEAVDRVLNRLRGNAGDPVERLYTVGNPRGRNWFWARYVADRSQLMAEGYDERGIREIMGRRRFSKVYTTTTYANRANVGEWYIAQMEATYPEGPRRDRALRASFEEASGDVYVDFDRHEHIVPPPDDWIEGLPPAYLELVGGIDFGGVHAFAFEAVAVDRTKPAGKEVFYFFGEHHQAGQPDVYRHATRIKDITGQQQLRGRAWHYYSDHEQHTRMTLAKPDNLGQLPQAAWKATEELRISELNRLFREGRCYIIGDDVGGGLLRPRCPGLVANLTQRIRLEDGAKRGQPEDGNNDATDAGEYAIGSWVKYRRQSGSSDIVKW